MKDKIQGYLVRLETEPDSTDVLHKLGDLLKEEAPADERVASAKLIAAAAERIANQGKAEVSLELSTLEERLLQAPDELAELLYRRGRLLEDELLDEQAALVCYQRILELRPGDSGAEERLSHINLIRENWEKIVQKYVDEAEHSTDKALTTSLYRSVAEIYQKNRPDCAEVEAFLRKSLEVDPLAVKSAVHLERLLRRAKRWDDLEFFYEERLEATEGRPVQAVYRMALGRFLGTVRSDREGMKKQFRLVLDQDPAQPVALKALSDAYQEDGNWRELIQIYEASMQVKGRGEPDLGMYLQIGMLWWKKIGDVDQAEPYFARVRKAEQSSPIALDFYRDYHDVKGEPQKLLLLLQNAQRFSKDNDEKLALAVEMAELAEHKAGMPDKAIDLWKGILRQAPADARPKAALRRLYQTAEKWNALLEILKDDLDHLPAEDVAGKVAVLTEMVAIYRERLQLDVMVINTYNAILALDPTNAEALGALAHKYESMNRWNDLIGVLARQAEATADLVARKALLVRVADLWVDKFTNPNKAIEPLEQILALDPRDEGALAKLKDIYGKRRNWRALLTLQQRELELLPEGERRPLLVEMADLAQKKLGDPIEAIQAWNRLLELDPHDPDALEALIALYDREKRFPALAEVLERRLAMSTDVEALPLLERLGALWGERIGSNPRAIEIWRKVLALKPGHAKAMRVLRDLYAASGSWTELEALFAEQGSWPDFIETLHAAADKTENAAERVALYFKVADTWSERLGKPDRAVKAFERVLAVEPDNLRAVSALVPIYEQAQNWPRLLAVSEVLLGHAATVEEKLELLRKIWTLHEVKIGSRINAFSWCAKAYALRPDDVELTAELERLAAEADAFEPLVELYQTRVAELTDEGAKVALLRKLAQLNLDSLGALEAAQGYFEQILAREPEDRASLLALEKIFESLQRWKELLGIYDRRVGLEADLDVKLELLFRAGTIQEDILKDLDAAVGVYDRILDLTPSNLRALRALEKLHQEREDWTSLAATLRRQLDLAEAVSERVGLQFRLGELHAGQLKDPRTALDFYKQALANDALHRSTVAALERFLSPAGEFTVEVASVLAPFYETTEDWERLGSTLEVLLGAATAVDDKLSLLKRLSNIYGRKRGDAVAAFANAQRVFALAPADPENRAELRHLAEMVQDFESLILLYDESLEKSEPALQLALAGEIAEIYDQNLRSAKDARTYYQKVLALEPLHEGAFEALRRILQDAAEWPALRQLLHARVELLADASARRDLWFQICALDEDLLADVPAAIAAYCAVLDLEPGNARAFAALERLYQAAEQFAALEALLAQELGFTEDPNRVAELQFRRGQILSIYLEKPAAAVDLFTEVLGHDSEHFAATASLEMLLERPELRQRVALILEPLYTGRRDWEKLVANLEVQLEAAPDAEAKVELLARIAGLQTQSLVNPDAAFSTWRRALSILPADPRVRQALEALIDIGQRWDEAAAVWQEGLKATDAADSGLQDEFMMRLARLHEEKLLDAEAATRWYRALLDKDPGNLPMAKPAAAALARLYEVAGDYPNLIAILRREVEWSDEADRRQAVLYRIAEIQEGALQAPAAAIATYQELAEFDPEDRSALDNLERLFFQGEKWIDLIGILRRRVELSPEPEERRGLLGRVAMLYEEALEDPAESVRAWLTVLDERPEDLEAIRALARLYEHAGKFNELFDMLERELALVADETSRVGLTYRLGELLHLQLGDAERAIYRYNQVLEVDRSHPGAREALELLLGDESLCLQAAEILEPLYAAESSWQKLCGVYELKARHTADAGEKVTLFKRIAEIQETGLGDSNAAFNYYGLALKEALAEPTLRDILDALERLTSQERRFAELVALYKAVAGDILDTALQEQVRLSVAEVSRLYLKDLETARTYFRQVREANPENRRALDALEEIYAQTEDWEPLLEILGARADLMAGEPSVRRSYLSRAALICEEKLSRVDQAITAWEQVAEQDAADREASTALERLYTRSERWADLADLIDKRFRFVEAIEEAVALRYQLGTLFETRMREPDRALENYRAALGGHPHHAEAIAALERFLADPDRRGEAAEVLEPLYAGRQSWPQLIEAYKIRRDATADPEVKPGITRRIAMLYEEQLEDLEQAFEWYSKLFTELPDEHSVRDQLTRLAGILGKWDRLAEVLGAYLAEVYDETDTSLEVGRQLAGIYDDRLDNVDKAKEYYLRVLAHDRTQTDVSESLERILTRASRWNDLLDVYRDASDAATEPEERKTLLFKICTIWEEALANFGEAIGAYRAVLEIGDNDRRAVSALDRLFVQEKRWADLVELLHRQLEYVSTPGEIIPIKLRLGGLYEEKLEDLATAIDSFEEVLGVEPTNPDAIAALERLTTHQDHRFRIAQVLEPIYRGMDEWRKLVLVLEAELDFIEDQARRVEILREVSQIHERRSGDLRAAFEAMAKAWKEEVGDADVLALLEGLALKLQDWKRFVEVLRGGIEGNYDTELQATLWLKIARIHEEAIGDHAAAVDSYNQLLAVRDDSPEGIAALERLLPALQRYPELVTILRKKADVAGDPLDMKDCFYKIAEIQEVTLGDGPAAIATHRHILSIDEADESALANLERLYLQTEAWTDLVGIYQRRIETLTDFVEKRTVIFQMAYLHEVKLAAAEEAISAYRSVLDERGDDVDALQALNRLFTAEKRWHDLLEVLDRQIALSPDPGERNHLHYRAGWVLEHELTDAEGAIGRYEQVLQADAGYRDARAALEQLVQNPDAREAASRVLEPLYRASGEFDPLIAVLELRLQGDLDALLRVELLRKVAELHEEGRGDLRAAFEAYGRAFAEDPASEELQAHLERLAGRLGLWADLAALYEKRLTDIYDDYLGRRLTMTLARVYEENLASDAKAVERYSKALEFSGDEAEPLHALNRLLERTRDYAALATVLGKLVDVVPDGSQQAAFLFRLGELRRLEFKDLDGALQAYRDVLDREPSHTGALAALEALLAEPTCAARVLDILEPVYEAAQNHERLAYLAWKRLELITDPEERARLLERIAEISEHQLGDPAAAQSAYGHALIQRPDEPSYLEQLERLAMQLGRWAEAAAVLENVLLREDLDDQVILTLSLKCAGWYADALQDVRRAELYYQKALTKDPENLDALGRVESIYRSLGDVRQLLDVLQRKADLDYDLDNKKRVLTEIAELAESALGDATRAAGAWKAIADLDEADPQAQAALIRLYEAAGQFEVLVEVLERVARFTPDAQQGLAYRHRMGELLLGKLGDADRAIAAFKDCLDVEPADEVALSALESIYSGREEWTEVQDIVLRRLSGLDPGPARIPVLEKLAQLAERRFDNADEATDYWNQILSYDPGNQNAFTQVERILEAGARWYDLVDVLKKHGEYHAAMGDRDGEVAQLVRTSRLWEEKLESPEAAAEILESILARDPNNVRALTGLARMHERTQDWDKCREVLARAAALSPAGSAGAELYFRMAKVEEKLGNAAGSRDCLSRALALDPTHAEALAAAEAAARAAGDWMEVAHLVHAKASSATDGEVQFPLLVELGLLYMQKLGHAEGGLPYLEQALRLRPSDPAVLGPLADLYIAAKRFGEAEQLIKGLIEAGQKAKKKPKDLAPFHHKLGMLAEARGDLPAATSAYDAAYKMDTTYTPVVVAQGRLAMNAKDWEKARRIFRAMLLQNLDEAVAGISKADVYYNLGWIHEQLGEKPKAINMYERGLELNPGHENLRAGLGRCKG